MCLVLSTIAYPGEPSKSLQYDMWIGERLKGKNEGKAIKGLGKVL